MSSYFSRFFKPDYPLRLMNRSTSEKEANESKTRIRNSTHKKRKSLNTFFFFFRYFLTLLVLSYSAFRLYSFSLRRLWLSPIITIGESKKEPKFPIRIKAYSHPSAPWVPLLALNAVRDICVRWSYTKDQ